MHSTYLSHPWYTFVTFVVQGFRGVYHEGHEGSRRKPVAGRGGCPHRVIVSPQLLSYFAGRFESNPCQGLSGSKNLANAGTVRARLSNCSGETFHCLLERCALGEAEDPGNIGGR